MMKLMGRLTTAILALMLALPTVGCQQKAKENEKEKVFEVQVDAGKTKVRVEGSKTPDEKGRRLDVDVERQPGHAHQPGDHDK
jgi:hypothetical protein